MKKKYLLCLIVSNLVISCGNAPEDKGTNPVVNQLKNNAALSFAINSEEQKFIAVNPVDGSIFLPCKSTSNDQEMVSENKQNSTSSKVSECKAKVIHTANSELSRVKKSTESVHKTQVSVNGQLKNANTYVIMVTAYPGSHCNTIYALGSEYENCVTKEEKCAALAVFGIPC